MTPHDVVENISVEQEHISREGLNDETSLEVNVGSEKGRESDDDDKEQIRYEEEDINDSSQEDDFSDEDIVDSSNNEPEAKENS